MKLGASAAHAEMRESAFRTIRTRNTVIPLEREADLPLVKTLLKVVAKCNRKLHEVLKTLVGRLREGRTRQECQGPH